MTEKAITRMTVSMFALIVSGTSLAAGNEPSREELMVIIKEEVAGRLENAAMAEQIYPGFRTPNGQILKTCNLWKYIELVDFTVVDKALGNDLAQYKLKPKFKWSASPQEIINKERCSATDHDPLGVPVKGGPAGDPMYTQPTKYTVMKTDKGWRLIN